MYTPDLCKLERVEATRKQCYLILLHQPLLWLYKDVLNSPEWLSHYETFHIRASLKSDGRQLHSLIDSLLVLIQGWEAPPIVLALSSRAVHAQDRVQQKQTT